MSVFVCAPAKINLYLGVHEGRDEQGYHRVDSVMAALDLYDVCEIEPASQMSVVLTPKVDVAPEDTTCWKAAEAMNEAFGKNEAYAIRVEKHIPDRAGLGGSSSDGAAVIRGICELWGEDPLDERCIRAAQAVGSDVAFFLYGGVAFLEGRGDNLIESFAVPEGSHIVLLRASDGGIGTAESYAAFDENPTPVAEISGMLKALREGNFASACANMANNLEEVAFRLMPTLRELVAWAQEQPGVLKAMVSGSGTCCFAACESEEAAQELVGVAKKRDLWTCLTRIV